jgi:putative nucleotidyltransferase with HDIG domain
MLPVFIAMEKLDKYLQLISKLSKPCKVYVVGGLIRDLLLERKDELLDCDIVVGGDVSQIARTFSQQVSASWFVLDEINQIYRVVIKDLNLRFDFAPLKGNNIYEDLKSRDYTINALAVEVKEKLVLKDNIIDPLGGLNDLRNRIIRAISEQNLIADPLRILRGMSLSSELNFDIESHTLELLAKHADLLAKVPGERISEELFKVLKHPDSGEYFSMLNELKILDVIFYGWKELRNPPPGPYHHLPIDEHSLETLRYFERMWPRINEHKQLLTYLQENIREGRRRYEILKLGCLLHDIGKPAAYHVEDGKLKFTGHEKIGAEITRDICERLKLSNKETDMLSKYVYYHLRPGFLVDCIESSRRAVFRYFRDTGEEAVAILLLSLADKEATRGELADEKDIERHREIIWKLINDYFNRKEEIKPPRLVTGWDVMKILNIPSGPLVGKILSEIEEAQAEKKIKTRDEAVEYMRKIHNRFKEPDVEK